MTAPNVTAPSPTASTPPPTTSVPPTTATPGISPSTSVAPSGAQDTGFRYTAGPNVPDYLVGRTPADAAILMQQVMAQNQQLAARSWQPQAAQPQQYGYQPQQPAYQPPPPALEPPKPEEWLSDQAGATKRYADYLAATQFAPQLQAQAAQTAQTNRTLVQLQRPDEFRRWGPEIDITLQQMAPNPASWTPQNVGAVVDMVKARHVNELIAEERAKFTNELGGASMRPSGANGVGTSALATNTVDFDKLPPGYRDALKAINVDQRTIDEFLYRTYVKSGLETDIDKARERWVKQVQRGDVFSDNRTVESPVYTNG